MSLAPFRVRTDAELVIRARLEPCAEFCRVCDWRYSPEQIDRISSTLVRPTLGEIAARLTCWCERRRPTLRNFMHPGDRMDEFRLTATAWSDVNLTGTIHGVRLASRARTPMVYFVGVDKTRVTLRPLLRARRGSPHYLIEGSALARIMEALLERAPVDPAVGPRGRWEGRL